MSDNENDFSKQLKNLEDEYDNQKPASQDVVPNGNYQCVCTEAKLTSYEKDNETIFAVVSKWTVLTPGDYEGKSFSIWDRLVGQSIGFFKDRLLKMELDSDTPLSELETLLPEMVGRICAGKIKNSKVGDRIFTNWNVYSFEGIDETV